MATEQIAVNMADFMDVVTTYRCKFCSFTSTQPQGIAEHVRKTHLATIQTFSANSQSVQIKTEDDTSVTLVAVDSLPVSMPPPSDSGSSPSTTAVPTYGSTEIVSNGAPMLETDSVTVFKNNTELQDFASDTNSPTIDVSTSGLDVSGTTSGEITDRDTNDASHQGEIIPKVSSTHVTKELFLCGQCGVGFSSVDECKTHMIADHNINTDQDVVSDRVNVGTQVEKKRPGRPGRRKKTEVVLKPDSDEDWNIEMEKGGRSDGRARRRTRPPKALKEDYYLGRRKKKEHSKSIYVKKYSLKCTVPGCFAKFRQEETLSKHIECHSPDSYDFRCLECPMTFPRWKNARHHMWKKHEIDMDLLSCDQCSNYKTDTLHKLRLHKQIHSEDKPYTCDVCGKGFRQISQMRNHQTKHYENRDLDPDKWYTSKECEICKRVFANQKCMKVHMIGVHSNVRPYLCTQCGYTSTRRSMLQLHLRTHTGEKPFKCDVCPYTTGDHNSLRRHKMRHTGLKPYKCPHCMYSCIQSISLKTHLKNKHASQEGVFCCHICSFRTVNKTNYKNHLLDHENGVITETGSKMVCASDDQVGKNVGLSKVHQVQMQVASIGSQEAQEAEISAEDLAKLSACEGLVSSDISVAQLIYSALSAVSQNEQKSENQNHVIDGVETSISSSCSGDGTTSHTITFHLPVDESGDNTQQTRQSETILVTSKTIDSGEVEVGEDVVQIDTDDQQPVSVLMETVDVEPMIVAKEASMAEVIANADIRKIET